MVQKFFKQKRQGNNRQSSIGRQKQNLVIFGGVVVSVLAVAHIGNIMEQSRLERDSVPIIISEAEDDIKLDYYTDKREISAKISGISLLAEVKVADDRANVYERRDSAGNIKYKIRNIKYGDSEVVISVIDGRRRSNKTIKFHRQMKADYDAQELKKALKRAEESVKNAEQQPTDEYISHAKSDIDKLPNDRRRAILSGRIAKLEKVKQEEKERAEKARQEAEDKKRQEAAAAAVAEASRRQHARVRQPQPQSNPVTVPAPTELHFRSCKEARAAGYSHIHRGQPGYAPHLDRDGDGIACDKHK